MREVSVCKTVTYLQSQHLDANVVISDQASFINSWGVINFLGKKLVQELGGLVKQKDT
ncbi:hypothetical protein ScFU29_13980 [Streptococcus canis]|nr:hypothetical protein ScFU29_13980 [Streptococcus canis]